MRRIIIQIEEEQYNRLREMAFKEHRSIASIVRDAIGNIKAPKPGPSEPSLPKENL